LDPSEYICHTVRAPPTISQIQKYPFFAVSIAITSVHPMLVPMSGVRLSGRQSTRIAACLGPIGDTEMSQLYFTLDQPVPESFLVSWARALCGADWNNTCPLAAATAWIAKLNAVIRSALTVAWALDPEPVLMIMPRFIIGGGIGGGACC
jgi:hypothetical protein